MSEGLQIGNRVKVNIGGQTHEMTIGAIVVDKGDGRAKFRSTTPSDHPWTKLWVDEGCLQ